MILRALTFGVLVVGLLVVPTQHAAGVPIQAVTSVGEPHCPHGGNYASVACVAPDLNFENASIVESQFNNSTMFVPASLVAEGDHVIRSLWAYSQTYTGACKSYIEQAFTYGFKFHNYYEYAVARLDYDYPSPGLWNFDSWVDGTTSDSSLIHTKFQTQFSGGVWNAWRNDSLRFSFSGGTLGTGGSCIAEAGLEVSKRQNMTGIESSYTAYTINQDLAWYDMNNALRQWGTAYNWIDYPCNLGQVPPNCLNGVYNNASQWADNKP